MVVIRLARGGDKKNPFYRIVVADKRYSRDGRYIERIGSYNPMARGKATPLELNLERLDHWQGVGAQMSDRVKALVKAIRKGATFQAAPSVSEQKKTQAEASHKAQQLKIEAEKKAAAQAAAAEADKAEAAANAPEAADTPESSEKSE